MPSVVSIAVASALPGADQVMGALAGVGDPAAHLLRMLVDRTQIREHRARHVAGLFFQIAVVDAAAVDARRGAGLEPVHAQRQFAQAVRERERRGIAGATAGVVDLADVDLAGEEGARGQHHGGRMEAQPALGDDAGDPLALQDQIVHRLLEQAEVGLVLDHGADGGLVANPVGLAAGCPYGRTLGGVQRAPLDAGKIRGLRHRAAECVDFPDQMALADAADGRVAAHLADGFDAVREQQGECTGASRGESGFGAGVAAADHDDVVGIHGGLQRVSRREASAEVWGRQCTKRRGWNEICIASSAPAPAGIGWGSGCDVDLCRAGPLP